VNGPVSQANPCPRETELLDARGAGFIGEELESHIATCAACRELRLVAGALLDERVQAMTEAMTEAALPSSGTMLWRMQMRRRQEAQSAARRSLLIGQAVTLAAAVALVFKLLGGNLAGEAVNVIASIKLSPPLLLAVATWLLAAPIAGWMLLRQK
jgi:predicted anti-sigma-YlaC factor YlaD